MGVGNVLPPQRGTVTKANNRPFLPDEKVRDFAAVSVYRRGK
jgi:hypothetical protein